MFYGVIKWDALPEFVGAEKAWCTVQRQTGPEGWDQVSQQWIWTAFWMVAYTELAYTVFLTCLCGESLKPILSNPVETRRLHKKGKISHSLLKPVTYNGSNSSPFP